jgi:hypothetical protein
VRPPKNRELPLQLKAVWCVTGNKVPSLLFERLCSMDLYYKSKTPLVLVY